MNSGTSAFGTKRTLKEVCYYVRYGALRRQQMLRASFSALTRSRLRERGWVVKLNDWEPVLGVCCRPSP